MKSGIVIPAMLVALFLNTWVVKAQADLEGTLKYNVERTGAVALTLTVVDYDEEEPVPGIEFEFFALENEARTLLGKATTNENGVAQLRSLDKNQIPKVGGLMHFEATFGGDDNWSELELARIIRDLS